MRSGIGQLAAVRHGIDSALHTNERRSSWRSAPPSDRMAAACLLAERVTPPRRHRVSGLVSSCQLAATTRVEVVGPARRADDPATVWPDARRAKRGGCR
jgi:hypothetical protein